MNTEEKNMSNQPNDPGLGRRDFLKKGAAVGVGTTLDLRVAPERVADVIGLVGIGEGHRDLRV